MRRAANMGPYPSCDSGAERVPVVLMHHGTLSRSALACQ